MPGRRKSGRIKAEQAPPAKKTRLSAQVKQEETPEPTPDREIASEAAPVHTPLLPNRVSESRPIPTLPEVQSSTLADEEYQSISDSRTLSASLQRSRQRWLNGEFFERYWMKSKKTAQIPNNPNKNTMAPVPTSSTSTCVVIVEPMIFEAKVYYVKDASAPKSSIPGLNLPQSQLSNSLRPSAQTSVQPVTGNGTVTSARGGSGVGKGATPSHGSIMPSQAPSGSQDPVIQLLAARASSDPGLKDLMKVVATGEGTQQQLQAFQRHIDELNAIVARRDASSLAKAAGSPATARLSTPQAAAAPISRPVQQSASRGRNVVPPPYPIVLEFTSTGASQDRFLFPKHAVIESLGNYSILASFLVFRKGSDASDASHFDPTTEYYEPITIKIDVSHGDTEVLSYIKRSVDNIAGVQAWMKEQMASKKRALRRHLPLRLPFESQLPETEEHTPEPPPVEVKKRGPYKKRADKDKEKEKPVQDEAAPEATPNAGPTPDPSPAEAQSPQEGRRRIKRSARLIESMAE